MSGPLDNRYVNNYNTIAFPPDHLRSSLLMETLSGGSEGITENRTTLPAMCSPISFYRAWTNPQALELPYNPTPKEKSKKKRKSSRDSMGIAKRKALAQQPSERATPRRYFRIYVRGRGAREGRMSH